MNRLGIYSTILAILAVGSASAQTITFEEMPGGTVVDGMVIGNVTFGFPLLDATVSGGPGITNFVADPSIEGDASGMLTLAFATPVLDITYGFALLASTPIDPGSTIEIFDVGAVSLGSFSVAADDFGFPFVEGENTALSAMPIWSAEITFANTDIPRFAFDNLEFTLVPESATISLFAIALLSIGCHRRRANVRAMARGLAELDGKSQITLKYAGVRNSH